MKIRLGFVANSSSVSFLIASKEALTEEKLEKKLTHLIGSSDYAKKAANLLWKSISYENLSESKHYEFDPYGITLNQGTFRFYPGSIGDEGYAYNGWIDYYREPLPEGMNITPGEMYGLLINDKDFKLCVDGFKKADIRRQHVKINNEIYIMEGKRLTLSKKEIENFEDIVNSSDLKNVMILDLSQNKISNLKGFDKLPKLKILILIGNNIETIKELKSSSLEVLDLSNNQIKEIGDEIDNLPNLKELYVSNNQIVRLTARLNQIGLKILRFDGNPIQDFSFYLKQFKVNEYITLRLEQDEIYCGDYFRTFIYINGEKFKQCLNLAIQIDLKEIQEDEGAISIDDIYNPELHRTKFRMHGPESVLSLEEEFWGHCSIFQSWFENNYNTKLLLSYIAFPLLKKLSEVGDPLAKKVFKHEIIRRIEEGNNYVLKFLMLERCLEYFSMKEIEALVKTASSIQAQFILWGYQNKASTFFYDNLNTLSKNVELAKLGVQNNAPHSFYSNFTNLLKNVELAKLGAQNNAPHSFYSNFTNLLKNVNLSKWMIKNNASEYTYYKFDELLENIEFAKWGVKNNATRIFYLCFSDINKSPELAKWGVQNNAPNEFYIYFLKVAKNQELAKWCVQNNAPVDLYNKFDKLANYPELAKCGIQNNAPREFYDRLDKLANDPNLAKWGVQNNAQVVFYNYFYILTENPELAKWGIQNNAPYDFYWYFDKLDYYPELAKWGVQNKLPNEYKNNFYEDFLRILKNPSYIETLNISKKLKKEFLERFSKKEGDK